MHALFMLLIVTSTSVDYLVLHYKLFPLLRLIPEAFSALTVVVILARGTRGGFGLVAPRYWFVFGLMSVVIFCGILTNDVGSGPTLAGMRSYLRAIPLFLLPAVYPFTEKQLKQQFGLILAVCFVQIPMTVWQRYTVFSANRFSGDSVVGTMADSGVLSIFLICCTLIAVGLMLKNRLPKWAFAILFFTLLFPTTINETKATVVLLPLGLLTTVLAGTPPGKRVKVLVVSLAMLVGFAAILIPVYDAMEVNNPHKDAQHLTDFFTNTQSMDAYLQSHRVGVGTDAPVRRGDAIKVPLQYLSRDPIHLVFGLGLGNASHSNLGEAFSGNYWGLFKAFGILSVSVFMLEIGLLGTLLVFVLYWLIFLDANVVARRDSTSLIGALAVGWIGVTAVMTVATFYTAIHLFPSLSYLFWYFSGHVAARRMELQREELSSRARVLRPAATRRQLT